MKKVKFLMFTLSIALTLGELKLFAMEPIASEQIRYFDLLPDELVLPIIQDFARNGGDLRIIAGISERMRRIARDRTLRAFPFLLRVGPDDPRVFPAFAALGNMVEVGGIIWSGVAGQIMNQEMAQQFCEGLGRGVRLPSQEDFKMLTQAMSIGPSGGFNPDLFPGTRSRGFWSSSVHPEDQGKAIYFNACSGSNTYFYSVVQLSVRCILEPRG
jgi:hypothetical protein